MTAGENKSIHLCTIGCIIALFSVTILMGQTQRWVHIYNGPASGMDRANSITYCPDGKIYIAGTSEGFGTFGDYTLICMNRIGIQEWVYRYNGPADYYDNASQVQIGPDGNLYTVGSIWTGRNEHDKDFAAMSISPEGFQNWLYLYDGVLHGPDHAVCFVFGPGNDMYIAGESPNLSDSTQDLLVVRLTMQGQEKWVYQYDGPGTSLDLVSSITLGPDNDIIIAGRSGLGSETDIVVISIDADTGTEQWVYTYSGPGPGQGRNDPKTVLVNTSGDIIVTGSSSASTTGNNTDIVVISLNDQGRENWIYRYNGPGNNSDMPSGAVLDEHDNLYITGSSYGLGSVSDIVVLCVNPQGLPDWCYRYNGYANAHDIGRSIICGLDGNIYAAGKSNQGWEHLDDATLISLTRQGQLNWIDLYHNSTGQNIDSYDNLVYGFDGNVYAAGLTSDPFTNQHDILVTSYEAGRILYSDTLVIGEVIGSPGEHVMVPIYMHNRIAYHEWNIPLSYSGPVRCDSISLQGSCMQQWHFRYTSINHQAKELKIAGKVHILLWDSLSPGYHLVAKLYFTIDSTDYQGAVSIDTCDWYGSRYYEMLGGYKKYKNQVEPGSIIVGGSGPMSNDQMNQGLFFVSQAKPNPFRDHAIITYSIPQTSKVTIKIYNNLGQEVCILKNESQDPGVYKIRWNGQDKSGKKTSSGVYFLSCQADQYRAVRKLVMTR